MDSKSRPLRCAIITYLAYHRWLTIPKCPLRAYFCMNIIVELLPILDNGSNFIQQFFFQLALIVLGMLNKLHEL